MTGGVDLRWHKSDEYEKLNADQRNKEQSKEGGVLKSSKDNYTPAHKKLKSEITSLIEKLKEVTDIQDDKTELKRRIEAVGNTSINTPTSATIATTCILVFYVQ